MGYLIDVNLPERFSLWHGDGFVHVRTLDDALPDGAIWDYAKQHNLTIVTKDADFSARLLRDGPPPSVVHVRVGNLRIRDLHEHLHRVWPEVVTLSREHALVNVFLDRIEAVGV